MESGPTLIIHSRGKRAGAHQSGRESLDSRRQFTGSFLPAVPVNVSPVLARVLMVVGFRPTDMVMRMAVEMAVLMAMRQ